MKRTYLAVFEGTPESWGGFMPDVPGTGGLGDNLNQARASLLEGVRQMMAAYIEDGTSIPEATTTTVDFAEFEGNPESTQYIVEWLTVDVPELSSHSGHAKQAA